ncbi:MAG: 16S rRNA methyltransferase [Clostridiales bacterium]|nr:MAG: 16S rRNA methyltransferase [Clostridiales bacterium]
MQHYWTENDIPDNLIDNNFYFCGKEYNFITSDGVFSKSALDFGSMTLVKAFIENACNLANAEVLDVGCGYGAMDIVLADKLDVKIDMADISGRAIYLANLNIDRYNFSDRLKTIKSDKYENIMGTYDYIITNPPIRTGKKNVHEIILGAYDYLKKDGALYIVISKKQGAKSAIKALESVYSKVEVIKKDRGYYIILAIK